MKGKYDGGAWPYKPAGTIGGGKASDAWPSLDGWLSEDEVEQTLQRLCGRWRCQKGSSYEVHLDDTGAVHVATTRPSGHVLRTKGLVRAQWRGAEGRIVWGRPGSPVVFNLGSLSPRKLRWERPGQQGTAAPYVWEREEEPAPEPAPCSEAATAEGAHSSTSRSRRRKGKSSASWENRQHRQAAEESRSVSYHDESWRQQDQDRASHDHSSHDRDLAVPEAEVAEIEPDLEGVPWADVYDTDTWLIEAQSQLQAEKTAEKTVVKSAAKAPAAPRRKIVSVWS